MLVGEIGIDRDLFLNDLQAWEIRLIHKGYIERHVKQLKRTRLLAFVTARSMGNNIKLEDIMTLPGDEDENELTYEEAMRMLNAAEEEIKKDS